jgi:hypothetical protein
MGGGIYREEAMFIYFIQIAEDGPIKIGRTRDVKKRLYTLQTGHHKELRVVHMESPPRGESLRVEQKYHALFKNLRIRGEWFKPGPALLDFIGKAPLTWEKMVAMDEDLEMLYQEAMVAEYEEGESQARHWYRAIKPQMKRIVGFMRTYPPVELQGTDAYEIAYHKIFDSMPKGDKERQNDQTGISGRSGEAARDHEGGCGADSRLHR